MKTNVRIDAMTSSPVRKVLDRARTLEREGRKIVHFEIGEPDFDTPEMIKEATINALRNNLTHYGPNKGLLELRRQISKTLKTENFLFYDPEDEIIVTVGAAEALMATFGAYINEGDEIIVFTPAFMNYRNLITMYGGTCIGIPLQESEGFQINPQKVRSCISPKTSMIVINNPHNPTGTVFTEKSLREIAKIAEDHNLLVVSDEIYQRIVYEGNSCFSIGSIEGMKKRTVVINGFSKSHAMTGWRLGYLAASKDLIAPMLKIHQYVNTCAPTFIQEGVAEGIKDPACDDAVERMVGIFSSRRALLVQRLKQIHALHFQIPTGAFYLFLNISRTGLTGAEFASQLLEQKGVAVVPGEGFDKAFGDYVRISYATSESEIILGTQLLDEFIENLYKK